LKRLVVDCSVVVALALQEPDASRLGDVEAWMVGGGADAPALWCAEVVNSLMTKVRDGALPQAELKGILMDIDGYRIRSHGSAGDNLLRLHALASKHGLKAYDASYLDTALRVGGTLATLDKALARAAEKEGLLILPRDVV
jgi:predicted nucleic acid-binding protein